MPQINIRLDLLILVLIQRALQEKGRAFFLRSQVLRRIAYKTEAKMSRLKTGHKVLHRDHREPVPGSEEPGTEVFDKILVNREGRFSN